MIVMKTKPLPEIRKMLSGRSRVLVVGCNTCAAVSLAGGEKEVETLVEALRLGADAEGLDVEFDTAILQRQCEPEFVAQLDVDGFDAVLSLGCGAGVAFLADSADLPIFPALDTMFIGAARGFANWDAECSACGSCVLGETAGICPVTRCAKGIMNGPCGGVKDGRCELGDRDCAWVLIYERLEHQGRHADASAAHDPKDHAAKATCPSWDASPKAGDAR